jgi:hypothetical protein
VAVMSENIHKPKGHAKVILDYILRLECSMSLMYRRLPPKELHDLESIGWLVNSIEQRVYGSSHEYDSLSNFSKALKGEVSTEADE